MKIRIRVDANGSLSVIKREYMIVYLESGCRCINLGGTAEVEFIAFVPMEGRELF